MKSLEKNQENIDINLQHAKIASMQQHLTAACLKQGLKITTTVGREQGSNLPYLQYAISFNSDEPVVFHGQARSAGETHYMTMFDLIHGRMVSEVFPPTVRFVQREPAEGSNTPIEEPISYWKRRLVVEHDITVRDADPKSSQTDGLHKVGTKTVWCGYNTKSEEIIRVADGEFNKDPEMVERVQYMEMGPRGAVVVVIFKDTKRLVEGEAGTFAEGLKTAQEGFAEAGQTQAGTGLNVRSTTAETIASSGSSAGMSSAGSGTLAPVSKLDLSGMAILGNKSPLNPDSELGKAVSRLSNRTAAGAIRPSHLSIAETDKVLSIYDLSNALWDDVRSYEGFKAYLPVRGHVAKPDAAVLVIGKSGDPRLIVETAEMLRKKKLYVVFAVEVSELLKQNPLDAPYVRELIANGFHPAEFGGNYSYLPYVRGNAKMVKDILNDVLVELKVNVPAAKKAAKAPKATPATTSARKKSAPPATPEIKKGPKRLQPSQAAVEAHQALSEKPVAKKRGVKELHTKGVSSLPARKTSRSKKPQTND